MVDKSKMFLEMRMMGMTSVFTQSTSSKPARLSMTKVGRCQDITYEGEADVAV